MILFGDGVAYTVALLSGIGLIAGIVIMHENWGNRGILFILGLVFTAISISFFIIGILDQTEAHGNYVKAYQKEIQQLDNMTCAQVKQWRIDATQSKINSTYQGMEHADEIARACK